MGVGKSLVSEAECNWTSSATVLFATSNFTKKLSFRNRCMSRKVGLWLVGAFGGVSTTVAVGLAALQKQITGPCGVVSSLPEFAGLDFVAWDKIVLGGHDIRESDVLSEAAALCQGCNPVIDPRIVAQCTEALNQFGEAIRPGVLVNAGQAIEKLSSPGHSSIHSSCVSAIEQVSVDLENFKRDQNCDCVVVVNLASTEPPVAAADLPSTWRELEAGLANGEVKNLPSSSVYAIAAIKQQMPFVNFTPSLGNDLPAICELAEQSGTCHMGQDGKTGETFLKSVLAPAFAKRNLEIMSWVGHNIFGNMDGQILDDQANKETKVASKGRMLEHMLGYQPQSHISIEYIKSLGDWKTAWDHIHFKGFLGTPMTMQFTWQGCDSILAAPLVLDLFRFAELAQRNGQSGLMPHLSSFFKSPINAVDHDFSRQFDWLVDWAKEITTQAEAK